MQHHIVSVSLLFALLAPVTAQRVLTVGSSGAFLTIQAAVDAAQGGDTVLVDAGSYSGATISKGIEVLGDGAVTLVSEILIENLPATESCRIAGLATLGIRTGLVARNCRGPVSIEDCNYCVYPLFVRAAALSIEDCDSVTVVGSTFDGCIDNDGATIRRSTVFVFDSMLQGGDGPSGGIASREDHGSTGLMVEDSFVYVEGSSVRGGDGGDAPRWCQGGDGGHGLVASGPSTQIIDRTSQFLGGAPGVSANFSNPSCRPERAGLSKVVRSLGVTFRTITPPGITMTAPSLARELGPVDYTIEGPPGSLTALGFAFQPAPMWFAPLDIPLLLGLSFVAIPVGTIPSAGQLVVPTIAPTLGSVDARRYFVQAIAIDGGTRALTSAVRGVTTLDSQF